MTPDEGSLETISRMDQIPERIIEAVLEGIAKQPQDFLIVGLGFVVGYEGVDLFDYFVKGLSIVKEKQSSLDMYTRVTQGGLGLLLPQSVIDIEKFGLFPAWAIGESVYGLLKGSKRPTTSPQTVDQINADPSLTDVQKAMRTAIHNQKARIVMGATGAIVAYMITRPGFLSGIGSIVQGVGEIIPG